MKNISIFMIVVAFTSGAFRNVNAQCTPPGDPSVYGDHVWNQYVWNSYNYRDNYLGFDVDTNLLYQSTHLWNTSYGPIYSATFSGCLEFNLPYSWSAKRKGFPAGNYTFDINYSNEVWVYVHGVQVFQKYGSGSNTGVWSGFLDDTSSVEIRSNYYGGDRPYLAMCAPVGNQNEWGDHSWNQYASNYAYIYPFTPLSLYAGYDVDTNLNYDSEHLWDRSASPSASNTYQGCYVSDEYFAWTAKRKGFEPGYYSIEVDEYSTRRTTVYADGTGAQNPFAAILSYTAFAGYLHDTSTVKLDVTGNAGDEYARMTFRKSVGDAAIFGDHVWNQYVWNSLDWTTNYAGYDVDTNLNYNSNHFWSGFNTPHSSSTYQGAGIKWLDPYSWSAKRKGFPQGYYSIDINNHDDDAELWINGAMVWQQSGTGSQSMVWKGCLNDSSKIEFRVKNFAGGASAGQLTISPATTSIIANGPSSICPGFSEILTAPSLINSNSFLWNTGDTTQSITVSTAGTYTVEMSGCMTLSRTITVASLPTPEVHLNNNPVFYPCTAEYSKPYFPIYNWFPGYDHFVWSNGAISHGNEYHPNESGDFFARGVDALGCLSAPSDTISVFLNSNGDSTLFGDHQWNVYVHADNAEGYVIGDPYYGEYVPPSHYAYAGYLVDTNLNFHSADHWMGSWSPAYATGFIGCSTTIDHFHISAKRQGFDCGIYQINIPAHDDDAYLYVNGTLVWNQSGIGNSIDNVWSGLLNDESTIEFKVYEFMDDNVVSIDVVPVQLFLPVTPTISGPAALCGTGSITLDEGTGFSSYAWSTGSTTQTTSVNSTGDYSVKVTDANGCVSTSQVIITTAAQYTYYADADGDTYGNLSVSVVDCAQPFGYVTDTNDCNDANNAIHPGASDICNTIDDNCNGVVDENAISATLSPSGIINSCKGDPFTLTANSGGGVSYQWLKGNSNIAGATDQIYSPVKTGVYKVKETNGYNCSSVSATASVTIVNQPKATIVAQGSLNICNTGSVLLKANNGAGYTYQWMKGTSSIAGAVSQNYTATTKGTYKVMVSNSTGCSKISNSLKVTKSCKYEAGDEDVVKVSPGIFPNPGDGNFGVSLYLEDEPDEVATIQIFNMLGQVVHEQTTAIQNGNLNEQIHLAPETSPGVYFVRIIAGHQLFTKQLLVQK